MYDPGQLYVDPILTQLSLGFKDQSLYGTEILPITPVRTQSGRYRVFDRSDWLIFADVRAPGTVANEVTGRKWSEDTFSVTEHSLQSFVTDEEYQELNSQGGLADAVFGGALQIQPMQDATKLITRSILLGHEKKVADLVRDTGNYAGSHVDTLTTTKQWDDYTYATAGAQDTIVSNPVADIRKGIIKVWNDTRRYPNTLVIPRMGISWIENHPRIVERFKNFSLTEPNAFQTLTGFEGRILLVDSLYNNANSVDATASYVDLWGKDVWLGIVDGEMGQNTQTFGKTFAQPYPDGSIRPIDRWREEERKADIVRASMKYDLKIVSATAGYIIKTAFSTTAF